MRTEAGNRGPSWLPGIGWMLTLYFLFFAVRLTVALVIDSGVDVLKDADAYAELAFTLANGHGFVMEGSGEPILWRAPLYPLFLSTVIRAAGSLEPLAVLTAQCLIDAGSAIVAYWIGRRLFGRRVGLLGGLLFAAYPLSAYYSLRFMPEPLFGFLITATTASLVWAIESRRVSAVAAAGALLGGATLVKPSALALAPFLALLIMMGPLVSGLSWRSAVVRTAALLGFFAIVLGPWTYRNFETTGHFVPATTGGGYSFWLGNNPVSDGMEDREIAGDADRLEAFLALRSSVVASVEGSSEARGGPLTSFDDAARVDFSVDLDRAFYRAGIEQILSEPLDAVTLALKKAARFWFKIFMPHNQWASVFIWAAQAGLLFFSALALVEIGLRRIITLPMLAVVAYFMLLHTATLSAIRYCIPILPLMMPLAAGGLVFALNRLRHGRTRARWTESPL